MHMHMHIVTKRLLAIVCSKQCYGGLLVVRRREDHMHMQPVTWGYTGTVVQENIECQGETVGVQTPILQCRSTLQSSAMQKLRTISMASNKYGM